MTDIISTLPNVKFTGVTINIGPIGLNFEWSSSKANNFLEHDIKEINYVEDRYECR